MSGNLIHKMQSGYKENLCKVRPSDASLKVCIKQITNIMFPKSVKLGG